MFILVGLIHVVLCIALILIVLLQTGKGSDLASAFGGGGAQAMFGGGGPASFLNKMTTAVAVLFMATSISLAYMSTGRSSSVMGGIEETAPVQDIDINAQGTTVPDAANPGTTEQEQGQEDQSGQPAANPAAPATDQNPGAGSVPDSNPQGNAPAADNPAGGENTTGGNEPGVVPGTE